MENINLSLIKKSIIKLDEMELEKRRQYREILKDTIKTDIEKSCDIYVREIKLLRDHDGFIAYDINDNYIKIIFYSNYCRIAYNGKFHINIKLEDN